MQCSQCGFENAEGSPACGRCGAGLAVPAAYGQQAAYGQGGQQAAYGRQAAAGGAPYSLEDDVQQNKVMAVLAYFIFFIPLIACPGSRFARYHANQGLTLLILSVGFSIVFSVLSTVLVFALLAAGLWFVSAILGLLALAFGIAMLACGIIGIVHAVQGRMEPMPVIGKFFRIIK